MAGISPTMYVAPISTEVEGPKVDFRHPDYQRMISRWKKCRDCFEGEEAVKVAGNCYLPRLSEQTDEEYDAYRMRAMFYGATRRTVLGLMGAIFGKEPEVIVPDKLNDWLLAAGSNDETFDEIEKWVVKENLAIGRGGMLVDAEGEGVDIEPYVATYPAESIINWQRRFIDGRLRLVKVVLEESQENVNDFETERVTIWRELKLTKEGTEWVYSVQLWEKLKATAGEKARFARMGGEIVPRRRGGKSIGFIPFQFINPDDTDADVTEPPVLDLVNINLSHYRTSADLEHGRHWTALPTPWVAGYKPAKGVPALRVGGTKAWVMSDPQATAGYLEFTGEGLGHLQKGMEEKQKLMAVMGSRLLEEKPSVEETASAVKLRHKGEQSTLATIAQSCSIALTNVLEWVCQWMLADDETTEVRLNEDYGIQMLDAQTLTALMMAYQAGDLSFETWFYNIQRAGLVAPTVTMEQERERIAAGGPITPPGTAPGQATLPPQPEPVPGALPTAKPGKKAPAKPSGATKNPKPDKRL